MSNGWWIVAAALLLPAALPAQNIRRSQEAVVRQKVADTWIELRYFRPVARGRSPLFGNIVDWGHVWTPGADSATTISVSTPIVVENDTLPRGSYSIWTIPDSTGQWSVIFNRTWRAWHTRYPGEQHDQLRVRVTAWQGAHMESLAWYFPSVDGPQAWRSLARSPGFVTVAVLALGLGLALSTTMFAVLDTIVNPHVPYQQPETLFRIRWWYSLRDANVGPGVLYRAVERDTRSYTAVVPITMARLPLEEDEGREAMAAQVTKEFFEVTGVRPRLGRGFVASDGDDVAVVSDGLWRRLFGKRKDLAGVTIQLGDRIYPVVGVMPRGSIVPNYASIWLPIREGQDPALGAWMPLVRLKPGVTREQAVVELKTIAATMTQLYARPDRPIHFELDQVRPPDPDIRDINKAMVGAALSVLLNACGNLAHQMLARGLSRRRELALRMALGASRRDVVWQMFAECAIVTAGGLVLGALGAVWGADILTNRMPPEVARVGLIVPVLSWRVFAFSAGLAVISAVLFGLLPALRVAFALSLDEPLKDGAGTTGRSRQRYSLLVVAEVALALVLMMGGGLLLRTLHRLRAMEFTFDARNLVQTSIGFMRGEGGDLTRAMRRDDILAAVAAVRGVRDVAFRGHRGTPGNAITAEMVTGDSTRTIQGGVPVVSWRYLRVHGLRIVQGRDFEPGDVAGNGVAILSAAAAQRLYPNQDAVGKMIKLGGPARDAPWIRIIGVARSPAALRRTDIAQGTPPVWVIGPDGPVMFGELLIRTEREDPRIATLIRRTIRGLPNVWYSSVESFATAYESEIKSRTFLANVFVAMGTVALSLAALGLYGVLAYAVNQRMREFAVRMALGAQPRQVFRMVLHDGFVMLLAGIGIGAFGALMAGRLLDAVLTTVLPSDVISLVACEVVLLAAGFAAAFGPARRAVSANPLDILRAV